MDILKVSATNNTYTNNILHSIKQILKTVNVNL